MIKKMNFFFVQVTFCSLATIFVFSFLPTKSPSFLAGNSSLPAHHKDAWSGSITSREALKKQRRRCKKRSFSTNKDKIDSEFK